MLIIFLINTHSLVSKGRRLDAQLKKMVCFQKVATKNIKHVRSYSFALSWLARDNILVERWRLGRHQLKDYCK